MKYTLTVTINAPIDDVIKKFDNADNMKHWQRGFISFTPVSGSPGEEGAKAKLEYKMGKREIEMIETITKKNLPNEFHGTYDTKGVFNSQENFFEPVDANTTKWTSNAEFKFSSFAMKFFGLLMPGAFKKQSLQYMQDFKAFVEDGTSVAEV